MDGSDVQQWIQSARNGDEAAFGELVQMYYQKAYGLIFSMVGNAEEARDLTQETWVKVWRNLKHYREEAGFFTWLYRIARNTALDHLRRKSRTPAFLTRRQDEETSFIADIPDETRRPDREAENDELQEHFNAALAKLATEHRTALYLREVEGLSYREIARVMRCRQGTVMSRIFYARKQLQRMMGEWK